MIFRLFRVLFNDMKAFSKNIVLAVLVLLFISIFFAGLATQNEPAEEITISRLVEELNAGEVATIVIREDNLEILLNDESEQVAKKETGVALSEALLNHGATPESLGPGSVTIEVKGPTGGVAFARILVPFIIPIFFIVFLIWFMGRRFQQTNSQALGFGQSRARLVVPDGKRKKITFKDVAGATEAKEELMEVVDFLKKPKKFLEIGAKIPRGVLLMGAPGTGKTLIARAVAGEAGVPFFEIAASEFVEMFVGVGASRVRDLFKQAKKGAPAIIFIDEIDAIGRHRGAGLGGGHDEREQTLNQILVEMDGFDTSDKVIVMGSTNRPDVLDPALLRPGRFDRRVMVDLPDLKSREAILKVHAAEKPLEKDVNLVRIAQRTPGLSGADLANLINEAAILAVREKRKKVAQKDLIRSIEKVLLGPVRKSHILSEEEKKITAYHEAGHALVSAMLSNADPVHKVSIVSRGRAGGYTMKLPDHDRHLHNRSHFLDDLAVSLGGYAAEEIVFGEMTTGASNDIKHATDLARALVMKYGMSKKVGPVNFGGEDHAVFLGRDFTPEQGYSEKTAAILDEEVSKLIKSALVRARKVIREKRKKLNDLADYLVKHESIEKEDFEKMMFGKMEPMPAKT